MGQGTDISDVESHSPLSFTQDKPKAFQLPLHKNAVNCLPDSMESEAADYETDSCSSKSFSQEKGKGLPLSLQKSSLEGGAIDPATSHVFLLRLKDLNLGNVEGSRDAKSFYAEDSQLSSGTVVRRPVFMKDYPEPERLNVVALSNLEAHDAKDYQRKDHRGDMNGDDGAPEAWTDDSSQKNLRDLPEDILQLCLARVPYRFHPRLRAVCRQWHALAEGQRLLQIRREAEDTEIWTFIMENEYDYYRKYLGLRGHAYHLFKDGERGPPAQAPYGCIMWVGDRPYVAPFEGGHPIPRLPTPLRLEFGVAGANGQVYVLGGRPPLNGWNTGFLKPDVREVYARVDAYCPARDTWCQVAHMPLPRYGFATAGLMDPVINKARVIVAGGFGSDEAPLSSADLYDPCADTWLPLPPMQVLQGSCRGEMVRDQFVVKQVNGGASCLESFDFVTRSWTCVLDHGQVDLDPLHLGDTNNNRSRSFASLEL